VGYRCKDCGLERSATHSLSPAQLALGVVTGFVVAFGAAFVAERINFGFFMIFLAAVIGGAVGQLVFRIVGRKSSAIVGAATSLGFLLGAMAGPWFAAVSRSGGQGDLLNSVFGNPWPIVFACVAGAISWMQLK
jgi:hypothetical protein